VADPEPLRTDALGAGRPAGTDASRSQSRLARSAAAEMLRRMFEYRRILWATTRLELTKRYAGSALGSVWVVLQPTLFLSIYLVTYTIIFRMRLPGLTRLEYVLFVFSGLAPYLGFMEAVTSGCLVVRQNLHLIKNVMIPIEMIPVRGVMVSMASQVVSLFAILLLTAAAGRLSPHWLWLPLALALQLMMLWGLVWVLSAVTVALPDVSYFTNLAITMLMFISPIGFSVDMVPAKVRLMVYLNPVYYLTEVYRSAMFYGRAPSLPVASVYVVLCLGSFALGSAFFRRFKDVLVDHE